MKKLILSLFFIATILIYSDISFASFENSSSELLRKENMNVVSDMFQTGINSITPEDSTGAGLAQTSALEAANCLNVDWDDFKIVIPDLEATKKAMIKMACNSARSVSNKAKTTTRTNINKAERVAFDSINSNQKVFSVNSNGNAKANTSRLKDAENYILGELK